MPDIKLDFSADDEGARRLVNELIRALHELNRMQQQSARSAARSAAAANQQAASLRRAASAANEQARALRREAIAARERVSAQRLLTAQEGRITAGIRERTQLLRSQAQTRSASAREAAAAASREVASIRLRTQEEARSTAEIRGQTQAARSTAQVQAAAARQAAAAAQLQTQQLRNQAQAQAAAARQVTNQQRAQETQLRTAQQAQSQAARQAALNTRQNIASIRAQQAAQTAASRVQVANIRAQQAAQASLRRSVRSTQGVFDSSSAAMGRFIQRVAVLAATVGAFRGFQLFIREGLKFNEVLETAALGIGSIITATSNIRTPQGRVLEGFEAIETAIGLARRQVDQLRIAGLQTAATTDELVQAYQSAAAAGIAAGLSLDEIRKVTVQVVQAAGTIGLPMQQLEQEVRSILSATIDRNSRVARVLNITNEQVRLAREENRLAEFLDEKLKSFTVSGIRAMQTWRVIRSNLQESLQVLSGMSLSPFFERMKEAGQNFLNTVFDFDAAEVSDRLFPIVRALQTFFDVMGQRFGGFITDSLRRIEQLGEGLNQDQIRDLSNAFFDVIGNAKDLVVAFGNVTASFLNLITSGEATISILDTINGVLETIAKLFNKAAEGLQLLAENPWARSMAVAVGIATVAVLAFLAPILAAKAILVGIAVAAAAVATALGKKSRAAREAARAVQEMYEAESRSLTQTADIVRELQRLDDERKALADEKETELIARRRESILRREATLIGRLVQLHPRWAGAIQGAKNENKNLREEIDHLTRSLWKQYVAQLQNLDALAKVQGLRVQEAQRALLAGPETGRQHERNVAIAEFELGILQKQNQERRNTLSLLNQSLRLLEDLSGMEIETTITDPDRLKGKQANDFEQIIRAQIARAREALQTFTALQKDLLDRNLIAYQEYFDNISTEEARTADVIRGLLGRLRDYHKDLGDKAKVQAEIEKEEEDRRQSVLKRGIELRDQLLKFNDALTDLHVRYLEATGEQVRAAGISASQEFRDLRDRIQAEMNRLSQLDVLTEAERAMLRLLEGAQVKIDLIVDHVEATAALEDFQQRLQRFQAAVQQEQGRIDLAQATGLARQDQIAERVIVMYRRQLLVLRSLRDQLRANEEVMQFQEGIDQLAELEQQILDVEVALTQAVESARVLRNAIRDAVQGGIEAFLASGIMDAFEEVMQRNQEVQDRIRQTADAIDEALERQGISIQQRTQEMKRYMDEMQGEFDSTISLMDVFAEAFRRMAFQVVQEIQKVIAQMIALRIIQAGLSLFSAGSSAAGQEVINLPAARGGFIWGPGTETSDSIPARLSRGEYVLSARAVKKIGVRELDEINFGRSRPRVRSPRYAEGGYVQGPAAKNGQPLDGALTVGLEDGFVLRQLESSRGQRLLVKTIAGNRRTIRHALGL